VQFYCPHALPDGNQRIRIWEKTLELYALPGYYFTKKTLHLKLMNSYDLEQLQ